MSDEDHFEDQIIPKALAVQEELLESTDEDIQLKTSDSLLDRSTKYGKKSRGGGTALIMDTKAFGEVLATLGKLMEIDVPKIRQVTPKKMEEKVEGKPNSKDDYTDFEEVVEE